MKKKLIVAAISSALVAPSAFAAQDDLGMQYTSAAEGFYGSLRARWSSSADKEETGANFDSSTFSRLGVRGTNDLGGGLEGYYQVEFNIGETNNSEVKNRLRVVGLRGGFGAIEGGTFWDDSYNFVTGSTDLSPYNSGRFAPYFRVTGLQYRTPDLNGFQGSIRVTMKNVLDADHDGDTDGVQPVGGLGPTSGSRAANRADTDDDGIQDSGAVWYAGGSGDGKVEVDSDGHIVAPIAENGSGNGRDRKDGEDENELDAWSLSAKYSFQGFTVAGSYEQIADDIPAVTAFGGMAATDDNSDQANGSTAVDGDAVTEKVEDRVFWTVGMGYGQDNWSVSGWYGERDARSGEGGKDIGVGTQTDDDANNGRDGVIHDEAEEIVSVAASVDVDKVTVYGVYEVKDNVNGKAGVEDAGANVGVLYRIGSNTNTWIEYVARDEDSSANEDDTVVIGLRHNF